MRVDRRTFLMSASALPLARGAQTALAEPSAVLGALQKEAGAAPVKGASWYVADAAGDGLSWQFPAGAIAKARYLTADMLLDGNHLAVFGIELREGEKGRAFRFSFGALNQCSFRVRMPLDLIDQNRWMIDREGAFLKPIAGGDRVDLDKVDRVTFTVRRKGPNPVRWCMTPLRAATDEMPRLSAPALPKGTLVDELGQSALHSWPGKTRNVEQMTARVRAQLKDAPRQAWPAAFSRWGGWKERKLTGGAGFFRTHKEDGRWWLVDPDGYAFWSAGLDCVRVDCEGRYDGIESALAWMPDPNGEFREIYNGRAAGGGKSVNYLGANMIRAFGASGWRDKWAQVVLAEMKRLRFNTVANWSDWEIARKARFPYVRPLSFEPARSGLVYRDFPDIFHPQFQADAAAYASTLKSTAGDPAFIGYFLMNEPKWGFSSELPAAGMLYNTAECHSRAELVRFLKRKYADDAALAAAWKMRATFARIGEGKWQGVFTKEALDDLRAFSVLMVERYFQTLSSACRKADPNHLNLGMRWAGVPPSWAVEGMKFFDVFSLNCYRPKLPREDSARIDEMLNMPVMVGEWHFGALDAGLPASGIGHLANQADRAKAYRAYLEDAAANPHCVGVHWFTLYDQSALGRFDGENYNIGFFDICNRPYDEMGKAAVASHERMYQVAAGRAQAFADEPKHLPTVFL